MAAVVVGRIVCSRCGSIWLNFAVQWHLESFKQNLDQSSACKGVEFRSIYWSVAWITEDSGWMTDDPICFWLATAPAVKRLAAQLSLVPLPSRLNELW